MIDKWNTARLKRLYNEEEMSLQDIGNLNGCTREYARQQFEKKGITRRRVGRRKNEREKV